MGIDYKAVFGIGLIVNIPDLSDSEFNDPYEYVENIIGDRPYRCEVSGSELSGNDLIYYIFINEPFKEDLLDFLIKIREFETFLNDSDLITEGNIDLIGGVHIF